MTRWSVATNGRGGPGAKTGVPAVQERNTWVPIREKRIQISGASLSFPVNALTGMFVGSDNPLYYLYTTFRSEFAYFRNVGFRSTIHDGSVAFGDVNGIGVPRWQRFLTLPLEEAALRAERGGGFDRSGSDQEKCQLQSGLFARRIAFEPRQLYGRLRGPRLPVGAVQESGRMGV